MLDPPAHHLPVAYPAATARFGVLRHYPRLLGDLIAGLLPAGLMRRLLVAPAIDCWLIPPTASYSPLIPPTAVQTAMRRGCLPLLPLWRIRLVRTRNCPN